MEKIKYKKSLKILTAGALTALAVLLLLGFWSSVAAEVKAVGQEIGASSAEGANIGQFKEFFDSFARRFNNNFLKDDRYVWLLRGLWVTVKITLGATLMGLVIGTFLALVKTIQNSGKRVGPLGFIADLYITVIRGTPVMVQLLVIYYVVFATSSPNKIFVAILAFGINSGAYVAEIIRAGIEAVDRGQMEAGRSLGFSYAQTMRRIIFPQAVKNVLPAMFNELITLIKETSVAGYIAIDDLTRAGLNIRNKTYDAFMPLIAIALIYLVVVVLLTSLMKKLERRLKQSDR